MNQVLTWVSFWFFVCVFEDKPLLVQLHISLGWMKVVLFIYNQHSLTLQMNGFCNFSVLADILQNKGPYTQYFHSVCENRWWSLYPFL